MVFTPPSVPPFSGDRNPTCCCFQMDFQNIKLNSLNNNQSYSQKVYNTLLQLYLTSA